MRIRNLALTATLIPVLLLAGCGNDGSSDVAASTPGAKKASKNGLTEQVGSVGEADPVVSAYYEYRVALDVMMRSGGSKTKQLAQVMTPNLFQAMSAQAKYYRTKKLHNTGATRVLWAKRTLASSGVIVSACYDTTQARTVDSKGRAVLPASTPTRWLDEVRIQQHRSRWLVDGGRTTPNGC
ncbi:hypothetical protein ACIBL3_19710 [Kribbella sp. NPDC050124]|uniref:hypothetical protein n=1 Tax=Kribbella sp. NPDC050124 TaxID=3364114 RepID=UPI0037B06213